MDEKIVEEFNERFATIEETLKYIADSQAKSEFISKQAGIKHDKEIAEIRASQDRTQRHLEHITKVLRFNIEEYEFQEDKITEAGNILSRKRKNNL
jgi:hypothetical protein